MSARRELAIFLVAVSLSALANGLIKHDGVDHHPGQSPPTPVGLASNATSLQDFNVEPLHGTAIEKNVANDAAKESKNGTGKTGESEESAKGGENNDGSGNGATQPSTTTTTVSTTAENAKEPGKKPEEGSGSTTQSTSSTTENSITTTTPVANGGEEPQESAAEAAEKPPKDAGMSSGIIALVMAIVFAVVVILVYVGLLLWRRYLEFRYANRELLVNDLEFDTNDLRHFEL